MEIQNSQSNKRSGIYLELHLALQEGNAGCTDHRCLPRKNLNLFKKKKKFERFGPKYSPLHRADTCRVLTAPGRYRAHPAEPTEHLALACKSRALLRHGRTAAASPGLPPAAKGSSASCKLLLQTHAGLTSAESTSPLPLPRQREKGLGCSLAARESFAWAGRKAGKGLGAKDSSLLRALPPAGRLMGGGPPAPAHALYSW